jgi:hypothetical protein
MAESGWHNNVYENTGKIQSAVSINRTVQSKFLWAHENTSKCETNTQQETFISSQL